MGRAAFTSIQPYYLRSSWVKICGTNPNPVCVLLDRVAEK